MAVLLLQIFPPSVVKSKCSHASSEMSYFYYLKKPGTVGIPNRILHDSGTEVDKAHKTLSVP
jgi:hypothetical protein